MIQEILKAIEGLPVDEKRSMQSDYLELVFMTADLPKWDEKLASALGPAAKPKGEKPSKEDEALTKGFGGIGADQILFRKAAGGATLVAMLWPWRDGDHITLKVAKVGGAAAAAPASAPAHAPSAKPPAGGPDIMMWGVIAILALIAAAAAVYLLL